MQLTQKLGCKLELKTTYFLQAIKGGTILKIITGRSKICYNSSASDFSKTLYTTFLLPRATTSIKSKGIGVTFTGWRC